MVERLTLGPASVSELAEPLAMSLAAVVQHVQVLEACGVVKTEKVGRTRMCRIERAAMTAAEQWITDRRRGWEARLDRLGDVLKRKRGETMSPSTVSHDTFVIERTYDVPVAQVFGAWADPRSRPAGSPAPPMHWEPATSSTSGSGGVSSIAVGLRAGPSIRTSREFRDIVPEQRIVYTYEMYADDGRISVSVRDSRVPRPRCDDATGPHRAGSLPRWPRHGGPEGRRNPVPAGIARCDPGRGRIVSFAGPTTRRNNR